MKTRSVFLFFAAFSTAVSSVSLLDAKRKNTRVTIDARSTEVFEAMKTRATGGLSYVFLEGKQFGGLTKDRSLEEMPFETIALELSSRLKKRSMFQASNHDNADMLLMVSWGTTDAPLDWAELSGQTDFGGDPNGASEVPGGDPSGGGDSALPELDHTLVNIDSAGGEDSRNSTASLLGIERAVEESRNLKQRSYELREMLEAERYFIVVQAFDYQKMKSKEGIVLLWSTRFSMDTIGASFEDAYLSLSRAAQPYFGENLDDLKREKTIVGIGEGTVGELEVIDVADEVKNIE